MYTIIVVIFTPISNWLILAYEEVYRHWSLQTAIVCYSNLDIN